MTKVSSTNLHQNLGVGGRSKSFLLKVFHVKVSYYGANWGTHGCTLNLFKELALEGKIGVFRQNSNKRMMSSTPTAVLSLRVGSFSNRSFITFRAGSIGTDVKRADTSYELRHSPGSRVMCLTCSTKSWVLFMCWGDMPTNAFKILASSFATPYVTDPQLDTIGLRRVSSLLILGRP